jgi:uncharacterized protein YyaL (SSP411 family)
MQQLYLITNNQDYLHFAYHIVDFVEAYIKQADIYFSSMSAVSTKVEGAYYQFSAVNNINALGGRGFFNVENRLLSSVKPIIPSSQKLEAYKIIRQ